MTYYCLNKWEQNKKRLEEVLRERTDLNECGYSELVKLVVREVLNGGKTENDDYEEYFWDVEHITVVDDGDYQGTLLFLIPDDTYQPSEYEYLLTFVNYGSCSGCDTLLAIQDYGECKLTERQVKDFMVLCKDIVANMVKPYNAGWRNEEQFNTVEFREGGA